MKIEALRQAAQNPNLPEADRDAARKELARLIPGNGKTPSRHPLEAELLKATCCIRLEDVRYLDIHRFCRDRGWSDEVKGLYFNHWLPAYMANTDWGRAQLSKVTDYLSRDGPDPELKATIDAWRLLREIRRRFRSDPEFAALFSQDQITELGLENEEQ